MRAGSRKLIATDESTVLAEPCFDPIVLEGGKSDGCFPNPPCTDESDGFKVFGESDDLLDQLVTPETIPRCRRREFTKGNAIKREAADPVIFSIADLA